jgi:universal stress protein A
MSQIFSKILCPVDLSSFSLDALKLAVKLAATQDATLDVLHVIHNPFDEIYMSAITQTDPALIDAYATEPQRRAKILRATEEHSEVLLKQFCHDVVQHYGRVRYHIRRGDPFEAILETTEDLMTDLVVLATHGRTGIKRLVIGNVAEKVVRHAPCPVLTVKPKVADRSSDRVPNVSPT